MNNLFIWFYTIGRRPVGVPQNDEMWLVEHFVPGEKIPGLNYSWMLYNPNKHGFPATENQYLFPKELDFVIENNLELKFDWLLFHRNIMIVSSRFLNYLIHKKKNLHFEVSKLNVWYKNGSEYHGGTVYYSIRIGRFDDVEFNFNTQAKVRAIGLQGFFLYPQIAAKENLSSDISFLQEFCYTDGLILTEEARVEVLQKFYAPEVYAISEYPFVFNNRHHVERLPPQQTL